MYQSARTALALLASAAMTVGLAQPAAAAELDYLHYLRGSATTTPGSVCVDAYVEANIRAAAVTLDIALNGAVRDSVTSHLASSETGFRPDSIQYERCFDVAAGTIEVTAVATVTPRSSAKRVTVPVLGRRLQVAEVPAPTVPAAPGKPSVQATGATAVKVGWAARDDGGSDIGGYQLRVSTGGAVVRTVNTTETSVTVPGLKLHSAYSVAVRARNAVGYSPASPVAGITLEVPAKPAKPVATATTVSSVNVAFKAPSSTGGPATTGYQVRVSQGSKVVKTVDVASDKRSVTVAGLKPLTRYSVDVRAKNAAGCSSSSAKASFTTKNWSAAAKWAAKTYGTFTTLTISGAGDDVIALPRDAKAGILSARYSGRSRFSVRVQDGRGNTTERTVKVTGPYTGTTLFGIDSWRGKPRQLAITASGAWTIQISAVRTAAELPGSGRADGVYLYAGGTRRLALTHEGHSNFTVQTYASGLYGRAFLVNAFGSYRGSVPLKKGPAVVELVADGAWTAKLR